MFMLETVCSLALWIGLGESRQNEIIAVETKEGLLISSHLMVYPPGEKEWSSGATVPRLHAILITVSKVKLINRRN